MNFNCCFGFCLNAILLMTLFVSIYGDLCDQCSCVSKSVIENCTNEIIICDGTNEKIQKLNLSVFSLTGIQWPRRNVSISASFNHLNISHLTK